MYITKKIALKRIRLHSDDSSFNEKAYGEKGTVYYQICNGTIGKGRRYKNYSEAAMQKLMNKEAGVWTKDGWKKESELKSNVIPFPTKEKEYDIDYDTNFTADDIPF